MARIDKLIKRLQTVPADFTWNELKKVLAHHGYEELKGGVSRRKFYHPESGNVIALHEPHPQKVVKKYALREVIKQLGL